MAFAKWNYDPILFYRKRVFFATKQNTTHRKSEKNPFLRALFHVFMTYFPECHANTKKPH